MQKDFGDSHENTLKAYFLSFAFGATKSNINMRLDFPIYLLKEQKMSKKQFVDVLKDSYKDLIYLFTD